MPVYNDLKKILRKLLIDLKCKVSSQPSFNIVKLTSYMTGHIITIISTIRGRHCCIRVRIK